MQKYVLNGKISISKPKFLTYSETDKFHQMHGSIGRIGKHMHLNDSDFPAYNIYSINS